MKKRIFAFIKKKYLCTLCCSTNNTPWANTFYYVFDEKHQRLIYVTSDNTYHAKVMQQNPQVAGTIFTPTRFNPSLQGVQFTGVVKRLAGNAEEVARTLYKQEYQHDIIDSLSVWEVNLRYAKMIDHTLGFYGKLEWKVGENDAYEKLEDFIPSH